MTIPGMLHARRIELPGSDGWIEIRGQFNPFDLTKEQRELIATISDQFTELGLVDRAEKAE